MLLNYNKTEYNEIIEDLRNNGYTVTSYPRSEIFIAEDSLSGYFDIELPRENTTYNDYSSIILWSLIGEDESSQRYQGLSAPFSITETYNGESITCNISLSTIPDNKVRVHFEVDRDLNTYPGPLGVYTYNFHSVMFIEGDGCALSPDNSLVMPNLKAFFDQASGTQDAQLSLDGKTKLLSLGDDECTCIDSAFKCYEIIPQENNCDSADVLFDGEDCHTHNSPFKLKLLYRHLVTSMVGFTAEEMATPELSEDILDAASENVAKFNADVTNCVNGCLYLEEDLIYPIAASLQLQSHIHIIGNNATIQAYNDGLELNIAPTIRNNKTVYHATNSIAMISKTEAPEGSDRDYVDVTDVTFENINFKGRIVNYFDASSGNTYHCGDQAIHYSLKHATNTDFKFKNVRFDGFKFAVHLTGETYPTPYLGWDFDNCEFVKSATPIMLSWTNGLTIRNSYIENSLSVNQFSHCVYIGCGCSNLVVDNCLLENSMGGAIHQNNAGIVTDETYNHNNRFTNLQIRNCNVAVSIGSPSRDILVENIVATNVMRGLHLENCTGVTINNFNASGSFYYTFIRKDEDAETTLRASESGWGSILINGFVDATISNSYFSTGGTWFYSGPTSYLESDVLNRIYREVNIDFNNCIFASTFSEHILKSDGVSLYEPTGFLGVNPIVDDKTKEVLEIYKYEIDFNNCQFFMNLEGRSLPITVLRGSTELKSHYNFNDCLVAYRYGNGDEDDSTTMPHKYFIDPKAGSFATITDCEFYTNLGKHPKSSTYGFVSNSAISEGATGVDEIKCIVTSEKEDFIKDLDSIK